MARGLSSGDAGRFSRNSPPIYEPSDSLALYRRLELFRAGFGSLLRLSCRPICCWSDLLHRILVLYGRGAPAVPASHDGGPSRATRSCGPACRCRATGRNPVLQPHHFHWDERCTFHASREHPGLGSGCLRIDLFPRSEWARFPRGVWCLVLQTVARSALADICVEHGRLHLLRNLSRNVVCPSRHGRASEHGRYECFHFPRCRLLSSRCLPTHPGERGRDDLATETPDGRHHAPVWDVSRDARTASLTPNYDLEVMRQLDREGGGAANRAARLSSSD